MIQRVAQVSSGQTWIGWCSVDFLALDRDYQITGARVVSVFAEVDSLPRTEVESAVFYGNHDTTAHH